MLCSSTVFLKKSFWKASVRNNHQPLRKGSKNFQRLNLRHVSKALLRQLAKQFLWISRRQLFFKSNQSLRKLLFRQLILISGNCFRRISGCLAINFCEIHGWFYLIFVFSKAFSSKFFGVKFLLTHKIEFLHHNFPVFDG